MIKTKTNAICFSFSRSELKQITFVLVFEDQNQNKSNGIWFLMIKTKTNQIGFVFSW